MPETNTTYLLTMEQAAHELSVSERYVRWLVAHDALPVVRLGRLVRFCRTDVEQYVFDHRRKPPTTHR